MKIIFEGLDNTGKSTQVDEIRKHYKERGFIVTKASHIKDFTPDEYKDNATKEYSQMFKIFNQDFDIICDRLQLGEYVYGNIYRKYDGSYVFDLERKYSLSNIEDLFLFVFIGSPEVIIERDDGLSFSTDIEKKRAEIKRFKEAFEKSTIKNKLLINIDGKSIEEITSELVTFINNK
jgi:thymidylate kinase